MRNARLRSGYVPGKRERTALVGASVLILITTTLGSSVPKGLMKTRNMHVIGLYDSEPLATGDMVVFRDHHRWYLSIRGAGSNAETLIDVTKPSRPRPSDAAASGKQTAARIQPGDQATAYLEAGFTRLQLRVTDDGLHAFDISHANSPVEVGWSIPSQPARAASGSHGDHGRLEVDRRGYVYFKDRFDRLWILTLDYFANDEYGGGS